MTLESLGRGQCDVTRSPIDTAPLMCLSRRMETISVRRAYKTELEPTEAQIGALVHHCGSARWAYNWGLQRKLDARANGQRVPNAIALHRELVVLKRTTYPWLSDVSKCAPQEALRDLDRAFANYRAGRRGRKVWRAPRFKSRRRGLGTFRFSQGVKVAECAVWLPRLGQVRLKEHGYLPTGRHVLSVTVSEAAGRWFVSVTTEQGRKVPENDGPAVGVDLGIATLATTSDGVTFENPRALERALRKLRRLQRALARKQKGSKNRQKARKQVAIAYLRVANVRRDSIHKLTTTLARTKSTVVVEDLHVSDMKRYRPLARALGDAGFGEIRRQLAYKTKWYGSELKVAPTFFASSRQCSCAGCSGRMNHLPLRVRTFTCPDCGCSRGRDVNAARNLLALAASSADSENACVGAGPAVPDRPSMQEPAKAGERPVAQRPRVGGAQPRGR